ncbi:MAG: hypothetical protein DMG78_28635 [Acidobacteria bacterium]|nr:MAG: hypothetical protein DMG78_28635 [Acidobacteriota bacterium]
MSKKTMRPGTTTRTRERSAPQAYSLRCRKPASGLQRPGAFQCTILRALELPKAHREVFLLKEIQGHTLTEIAAFLGISIDTARVRWKRARREIGHLGDSGAIGRAQ